MEGSTEFEYEYEDDRGLHTWYVTLNYVKGYAGNAHGSPDTSYEALDDEHEVAKVEEEFIVGMGENGEALTDYREIEISRETEEEIIDYYLEQERG